MCDFNWTPHIGGSNHAHWRVSACTVGSSFVTRQHRTNRLHRAHPFYVSADYRRAPAVVGRGVVGRRSKVWRKYLAYQFYYLEYSIEEERQHHLCRRRRSAAPG